MTARTLTKAADLAAEWDMDEPELKRRVRRYGWPVVKLSRTDWRFTEQQVEQIVAMQSSAPKPRAQKEAPAKTGQSKASRKRAS
jgi:hypothetical protein